jgi:pSer/pThr/pTyr-binding forkhead associated (FHA) protein
MAGPAVLRFSRGLPPTKQYGERLRLLVRQGQDQGTCYSLLGDLVFIGREDCQIVLNDTNISRKHAEISWKGDHYVIRDLGSANGIVFNGTKVPESKLNPGDIVLMGLTVVEVYPPGQTRKNEKPMLATPMKRLSAVPTLAAPLPGAETPKLNSKQEKEQKRKVERKRMFLFVAVFFLLAVAYFNDDNKTIRTAAQIPNPDVEDEPTDRGRHEGKPKDDHSEDKIKGMTKNINDMKMKLGQLQNQRSQLEEHLKTSKNLSAQALIDENSEVGDKAQRKDADIFYRNGVRELQNKNYRRAFTAFETALTVDPQHELAKIYLKSAKMELLSELWSTQVAGLRAKASLRYKESRMHFENIVRYMENENGGSSNMEGESNKELKELYDDAKKELADLDALESKGK